MQWDYLLNDQLKPAKTEGMTNPKITPFLTCPSSHPGPMGGTPPDTGAAVRHVRKGTAQAACGGEHSGPLHCGWGLGCDARGCGFCRDVSPDEFGGEVSPCEGRENSVGKPRREFVGPLTDCGLADANGFGGGCHSAAQELNGFGLVHG